MEFQEKSFRNNCRENILVSIKEKFIDIGSVVFELLPLEKCHLKKNQGEFSDKNPSDVSREAITFTCITMVTITKWHVLPLAPNTLEIIGNLYIKSPNLINIITMYTPLTWDINTAQPYVAGTKARPLLLSSVTSR